MASKYKIIPLFTVFMIVMFTIFPALNTAFEADASVHGLEEWEEELIGSDSDDPKDPGLYVRYDDDYRTLKYSCWESHDGDEGEVTLALEKVVVRIGTTLLIGGYTEADHTLTPSKEDMNELEVDTVDNGWKVDIEEDSTLGRYTFSIQEGDWSTSIDIFIILDPWRTSIPEEKLKGYAYDEEGLRDEYGFIYTTSYTVYPGPLHPFEKFHENRPEMYEFALSAVGNESDPKKAAARLYRIVAQRNDARPFGNINMRDASDILFYGLDNPKLSFMFQTEKVENLTEGDIPSWLGEEFKLRDLPLPEEAIISYEQDRCWIRTDSERLYKVQEDNQKLGVFEVMTETSFDGETTDYVEGLTLEDAEKLAMNDVSIYDLEEDNSKIINGWCDEVSFALVSLLRSIGIPSRVVSVHPTPEVDRDLMGHFMVEAWFEESLYESTWNDDEGGWYVLDADEWNAHWTDTKPEFWMPMGETFSSRKNFMTVAEELFQGRFITESLHVFGPESDTLPEPPDRVDVTDAYIDAGEHRLEHGSISKLIGRGGGDLYNVTVEEPSKLILTSDSNCEPEIYHSTEDYPITPIATEGYPFESTPESYVGEELILSPGTHYIGIYGHQNSDRSVEGNYGYYTLTLEETDEDISDDIDQEDEFIQDLDLNVLISMMLIVLWIISYMVIKYL